MRHMLLHASILLNPSSGDVKPSWTVSLPVTNNVRRMCWACLWISSNDGRGRGNLLWKPPSRMDNACSSMSQSCCAIKRTFCSPGLWTPRFKPMKKKLSLVPPMCHGEMDIVSVKELADGSLQFTFGTPTEGATNVDKLSSIHGEHLAGKLKNPSRRPSGFRKQSPVPAMAARRIKKQPEGLPLDKDSDGAICESSEGSLKVLSRPKSTFAKRSPIPRGKVLRSGDAVSEDLSTANVNHPAYRPVSKKQHPKSISQKVKGAVFEKEIETSVGRSLSSFNGSHDSSSEMLREHPAVQQNRSKSRFHRRSPIPRVSSQTPQKSWSSISLQRESQRQTVPSHLEAKSQIGSGSAKEAGRNLVETKDTVKSSDSESLSDVPTHSDLRKYKLPELKSIAKSRGLKGYSKLKKEELLDLLEKT